MTKRIFTENPLQLTFEARVLGMETVGKSWELRLDRTAFYPEGGGQPADHGTLGGIPVIDVQEKDGEIIHILTDPPSGKILHGEVDGKWRHDYMQQHTGQHIISAAFWETSRLVTLSVHMGVEITTIDLDTAELTDAQLDAATERVDRIIAENRPLDAVEAAPEELTDFPLRKPPPVPGPVRLVRIRDFDCVGCCGMHLPSTGPVRMAVCTGREKIRGKVRTTWKIGDRVFDDLRSRVRIMSGLRASLGTNDDELGEAVARLTREAGELRADMGRIEIRLADLLVREMAGSAKKIHSNGPEVIARILDHERPNVVKSAVKELLARKGTAFVVINTQDEGMTWSMGVPEGVPLDFANLRKQVLDGFGARGGGRPPLWQGSAPDPTRAPDLLEALEQALDSALGPSVSSGT